MRSVALVLSALLLVSFYGEAFGQCGSWTQEEYSVNENDNLVEVTATFPTPVQVQTFLRWTTVAGSATGMQFHYSYSINIKLSTIIILI